MLLLGCGLGMLSAVCLLPFLNRATDGNFPPLFVHSHTWLTALGIAIVLALMIGLPQSLRVWRLKIIDALAGH